MGESRKKEHHGPKKIVMVDPANSPEPEVGVKYLLPGAWVGKHPREAADLLLRLLLGQRDAALEGKNRPGGGSSDPR